MYFILPYLMLQYTFVAITPPTSYLFFVVQGREIPSPTNRRGKTRSESFATHNKGQDAPANQFTLADRGRLISCSLSRQVTRVEPRCTPTYRALAGRNTVACDSTVEADGLKDHWCVRRVSPACAEGTHARQEGVDRRGQEAWLDER